MSQSSSTIRSFGFFLNGELEHARARSRGDVALRPQRAGSIQRGGARRCGDGHRVGCAGIRRHAQDVVAPAGQHSAQDRDGTDERGARNLRVPSARKPAKPIKTARVEVDRAINTFQIAAEESTRIYGESIPLDTLESTGGPLGDGAALSAGTGVRHHARSIFR